MLNTRTLIIILIGFLSLTAGLLVNIGMRTAEKAANAPPIEFSFPDRDGKMQAFSQWRGKPVVLNFWATWCGPCREEIPQFIKLQAELGDRVQFVGIAIDDVASVIDYLDTIAINYPILITDDDGMQLSMALGNVLGAIPFTVIINPAGQVVDRKIGELSIADLNQMLAPLLKVEK